MGSAFADPEVNLTITPNTGTLTLDGTTSATLTYQYRCGGGNGNCGAGGDPYPADLSYSAPTTKYSATIYAGTTITGDGWDGIFTIPTITTDFTITNGTPNVTVTVGSNAGLTFDKAVKIVIGGMAGKKAAYNDGVNTYIIAECTAGQIADPDTLPAGGECYTDNGTDMIIWTKHLTDFAAYTQNTSSGGSNISGGTNRGSSGGYYVPVTQPTPENPTQPTYEPYNPTQPVTPTVETPETEYDDSITYDYKDTYTESETKNNAAGTIAIVLVIAVVLGMVIYLVTKKKGFKRSRL